MSPRQRTPLETASSQLGLQAGLAAQLSPCTGPLHWVEFVVQVARLHGHPIRIVALLQTLVAPNVWPEEHRCDSHPGRGIDRSDRFIGSSPRTHPISTRSPPSTASTDSFHRPVLPCSAGSPPTSSDGNQDSFIHPDDIASGRSRPPGSGEGPERGRDQRCPFPMRRRCLSLDRSRCRGWSTTATDHWSCPPFATSAIARSPNSTSSYKASTDPLTGVANRTVFMDRLRQALRRLDRHETASWQCSFSISIDSS